MRIPTLLSLLTLLLCTTVGRADEPLAPPARYEIQSPAHKYVASLDPKTGVAVRAAGSTNILWTATNWFRVAFLADDGQHLVTGYDGMNLIPQNYAKDLVLITFWQRDRMIRDATAAELIPDPRVLQKTVSNYHWGMLTGITNHTLTVRRCDGKMLRFDVTTGRLAK